MLTVYQLSKTNPAMCRLAGELDAFTVGQLRQAMAALADSPQLIIELSSVTFVDSAGLSALVGGIRRTRELGGEVAIACNRPGLLDLLRSTGFDRIVAVAATVDLATAAFREPKSA
jgi:anti-sigma B factor antagonist